MNRLLELETQLAGPSKRSGGGLAPRRSPGSRAKLIPWGKRPALRRKAGEKNGAAPVSREVSAAASAATSGPRPVIPVYSAPSSPFTSAQQAAARSESFGNSSTVAAALAEIAAFRGRTGVSRWKLARADVATRLEQLVSNPILLQQGSMNLCGPAAAFHVWMRHDPRAFARYAISLYETGVGHVGTYKVEPGGDLLNQDYSAVLPRMTPPPDDRSPCPTAEWMAMSALRDEANALSDFEGTPEEEAAGLTTPGEVADWLKATGVYRSVLDQGNWVFTQPLSHAFGLMPTHNVDVVLLINAHILSAAAISKGKKKSDKFIRSAFPNHFIVLKTPLVKLPDGKIQFTCWTWGAEYDVKIDPNIFQANYYGAVIAEV